MTQNTKIWLHGLGAVVVGGAANAGMNFFSMAGVHSAGISDVAAPNLDTLLVLVATGGLTAAFAYLKQSPLPPEDILTVTETKTTTITAPAAQSTETTPTHEK